MPRGPLPPLSHRRQSFKLPDTQSLVVKWIAEGDGWVVISKPAQLLSVPGSDPHAQDSAETRVRARYPQVTGGIVVHRLDLPTSGLMVFALRADVLSDLNRQFAKRTTSKRYTAVLCRSPQDLRGEVKLPLRLDPFQRPLQVVDPIHGRPSQTRWSVVGAHDLGTVVSLYPITGRTHQLRIHAAHPLGLNAPIVGDPHYARDATADGSPPHGQRLHLHADSLCFDDPITGERICCEDPAPFINLNHRSSITPLESKST